MKLDQRLIAFMLDPKNYQDGSSTIAHIETHISHIFLSDSIVYKIKKPVNLEFLDFSTLKRRLLFCKEEVLLNSRLAPDTYLGVEPIFSKGGSYSFQRRRGWHVAEYAVKMKKIPMEYLLSHLIEQGMLLYREIEPVGDLLADFHRKAFIYKGSRYGSLGVIEGAAEQNFRQIEPFIEKISDRATLELIITYTREFLKENRDWFAIRKQNGWVRDGHGDLHSQHICLSSPPLIFDCIEFNKAFRIEDVLNDITFLLMDLEYKARFDLSLSLFKTYFTKQGDALNSELLRFYKVYRAVVRGKVGGLLVNELPDSPEKEVSLRAAQNYLSLARFYIEYDRKPFNPIVFMGLSGSGKSTIARKFAGNSPILRSDEIRKVITGVKKEEHRFVEFGSDIYSNSISKDVYRTLLERALSEAKQGKRVVVDATYLKRNQRRELYESCITNGLNPFFVHCAAAESVLRDRIKRRIEEGHDVSDAHAHIIEQQIKEMEEPVELPYYRVMRLNTETSLHNIVSVLKEFL